MNTPSLKYMICKECGACSRFSGAERRVKVGSFACGNIFNKYEAYLEQPEHEDERKERFDRTSLYLTIKDYVSLSEAAKRAEGIE
jgi:hypothetical protein